MKQRTYFVLLAAILLLLTTERFTGDLPAFFWSLIVLGGFLLFDSEGGK